MSHISTNETFLIDAPVMSLKCLICLTEANHRLGWIGACCSNCGTTYDVFELTIPDIVKMQRNRLNSTRRALGEFLGYKSSSIKRYELRRCSLVYYEKMKTLTNLYNMGHLQFIPTRKDYDSRSLPEYYLTSDELIGGVLYVKDDSYSPYSYSFSRLVALIKAGKLTSVKPKK
jgi:transcriptional regulator with XRE-family HTH domain